MMQEQNTPSVYDPDKAWSDTVNPANVPDIGMECPLCKSVVKLYFINYEELFLMCSNVDCEYPFGYEKIKMYTLKELCSPDHRPLCYNSTIPSNPTSTVSSSAWADIEQMNKAYEADECHVELKSISEYTQYAEKPLEKTKEMESEERLNRTMQNIKELNVALTEGNDTKGRCLSNEKYIKHLLQIQKMSGYRLLKQGELRHLKDERKEAQDQLKIKIDIESKNDGTPFRISIEK